MKALIVGATGATGKLLTEQLLEAGHTVKIIVRSTKKLKQLTEKYPNLIQFKGTTLDLSESELQNIIHDCDVIYSCLGHNLTFKGLYGKPRRLVRDTLIKLYRVIEATKPKNKVKFVLMNTTGYANRDLKEVYPFKERVILNLLYMLLPPHTDNIQAAEFLRTKIGQTNEFIDWVIVRPDTLVDEEEITQYVMEPITRGGAIFLSEITSRINTANAMMRLGTDEKLWENWKGKMPVIYNRT